MDAANSVPLDKLLELDKIIHERVRLGIMAALSVSESLTFQYLKQTLKLTDGNLSVHLRLLEKNNYVLVAKSFVARKPCSSYRLTPAGREAFKEYVQQLEKFIHKIHQDDIATK
jgi:DNA-binding MarR family transcriptional regulator